MTPSRRNQMNRRGFMRLGTSTAGAVAAVSLGFDRCRFPFDPKPDPPEEDRNPLLIPPVVAPAGLALSAAPSTVDLGGGAMSSAWAFNGGLPGPTIRAHRGDRATIQLQNGLVEDTITHWHGMVIDDLNDGHPRHAVGPGQVFNYDFPIVQRACMNWYHPHPHGRTGAQVNLGMAGAFIITDNEEAALNLPSGPREIPLIIRDATINADGDLEYQADAGGFFGDTALVNGTQNATIDVDTAPYRLRILNGANARVFRLALDSGASFTLIGNDGGLIDQAIDVSEIVIATAERVDVVVDFSNLAVGDRVMLQDLDTGWDLLEFAVANVVNDGGTPPSGALSVIPPLSGPVVTREFAFEAGSRINGVEFDIGRIDEQVPLNQTERWIFSTVNNPPHPIHVHAAPFQVQSRTGGRGQVFPWERGWKDTVLLQGGESVEVLVHFDHAPGIFLIHCHKLEHEDAGMMMNFELV